MKAVQRFCLALDLQEEPKLMKEYIYWHKKEHIWPEIPAGIKAVGILNMEIYHMGNRLFMIIEAGPDFKFKRDMKRLALLPRQAEWEAFVAKFQNSKMDDSATDKWKLMEKIFSLE